MDNEDDIDLEAKKRAFSSFSPASILPGISAIESSSGQSRVHPNVTTGVNAGTHSVSSYGLMPNTVYEFAKRNKQFRQTPEGQAIYQSQGNPDTINKITENPQSDDTIMQNLVTEQNQRLQPSIQGNQVDPEIANVLANRRGVQGAIKAIRDGSYANDPYVQKYLELKNKLTPTS